MTSNIGTADVGKNLGFTKSEDQLPDYSFHVKQFFRPEFLNRIDEVVIFKPLSSQAMDEILDLQLAEVRDRLREQSLSLELDTTARELLLREGYDPANGARPLRRALERMVTRPLSSALIEEQFKSGDVIRVVAHGDELVLEGKMTDEEDDLSTQSGQDSSDADISKDISETTDTV
jgi:ATP-dependent Clp protease ATP-binding subunit ClpA